mgnify:CR=1 FL=1
MLRRFVILGIWQLWWFLVVGQAAAGGSPWSLGLAGLLAVVGLALCRRRFLAVLILAVCGSAGDALAATIGLIDYQGRLLPGLLAPLWILLLWLGFVVVADLVLRDWLLRRWWVGLLAGAGGALAAYGGAAAWGAIAWPTGTVTGLLAIVVWYSAATPMIVAALNGLDTALVRDTEVRRA